MTDKLKTAVRVLLHDLRWVLNQITLGRPPDPADIEYLRTKCDIIEEQTKDAAEAKAVPNTNCPPKGS